MDEYTFKQLMLAGGEDDIEEFINLGYFKRIDGVVCRTDKFNEETAGFINSMKESLYQAVRELGSAEDMNKTMEMAGIKDFITFVFIAEELVQDGRLKKDKEKNVVPV